MAWSICADDNKQTFVQTIIINHLHDERWQKTIFRTIMNLRVGPLVHNTIQLCVLKTAGIKLALLQTVALLAKNCCFNCVYIFVLLHKKSYIIVINCHITVLPNNALGPVGYCTSHFKRAVCISCQPRVDVHKGDGVRPMRTGEGVKNLILLWTS